MIKANGYAGPVCGKCHKGMTGDQGLRVSDDWEKTIQKHYGQVCDTCKRSLIYKAIENVFALPWDLPGHEHTNAKP